MTASPNSMLARRLAVSLAWAQENNPGAWWFAAASACMQAGHFRLITSRDGTDAYMLRCWLTPPKPNQDKDDPRSRWESGDSTLLHWILRPDDDAHLHDHPWDFVTTILAGGYCEQKNLMPGVITSDFSNALPGARRSMEYGGFHRIHELLDGPGNLASCAGGAWTLVQTTERNRRWGFMVDGQWQDARVYLNAKGEL